MTIIFQDNGTIVMAELKSRSFNVSDIVKQLTNGGNRAVKIATDAGARKLGLYFILLVKNFKNYSTVHHLNLQKVHIAVKHTGYIALNMTKP